MSPRLRAAGTLLAVFALGAATGSAVTRFSTARAMRHLREAPPAEARRRMILRTLERELSLSREQRERIEAILASHNGELAAIARRTEPEVAPVIDRIQGEIRGALAPEQQGRFDVLAARFNERRRRALTAE